MIYGAAISYTATAYICCSIVIEEQEVQTAKGLLEYLEQQARTKRSLRADDLLQRMRDAATSSRKVRQEQHRRDSAQEDILLCLMAQGFGVEVNHSHLSGKLVKECDPIFFCIE
jgi:hypothetical protein